MEMEEVLRILAAADEKAKHRKTERALGAGFASLEKYEQHQLEEERQEEIEREEAIKEHCLATDKSREQYDREREEFLEEQIERHPKSTDYRMLPPMDNCNCDGPLFQSNSTTIDANQGPEHAFPFFCPPSLVDYKSQDHPDMMEYISARHHLDPEDIKIQDTDRSKRLDQEQWEQYMARKPDDATVDLPFWARADCVVLQIMRQSGLQGTSISPSPSPRQVPGLLPDDSASGSPLAGDAVTDSTNTSMEVDIVEPTVHLPHSQEPPLSQVSQSELSNTFVAKHTPKGRRGEVRKIRPRVTAKDAKGRTSRESRITKSSWKPAMGLRSRNVATFYKLGCDGKAADSIA
ncbi:MAG: hypothetical protein L6R38_001179 [Xanthoria sp. 2 TBL-2021]|nr:MAG: hypothetical protein L6R38_001179 [Xanthoria sp. 2 TBL-2021]